MPSCSVCKGVGSANAQMLLRRRWRKVKGKWFCPRPACTAAAPRMESKKFDLLGNLRAVFDRYAPAFQSQFHAPLDRYWDESMGLDVVKMESELLSPDDTHSANIQGRIFRGIRRRFGPKASDLVREIIQIEKAAADSGTLHPYAFNINPKFDPRTGKVLR